MKRADVVQVINVADVSVVHCGELAKYTSRRVVHCGAKCTSRRVVHCGELADDEERPLLPVRRGAEEVTEK